MVRLGLVKDLTALPAEYRYLAMRQAHGLNGLHTEARSWPVGGGEQRFELVARVGFTRGCKWAAELAGVLAGMGWRQWAMDPLELSGVLGLAPEEAMALWGGRFFAAYAADADVVLRAGAQRETIRRGLAAWEASHPGVAFAEELDFDGAERARMAKRLDRKSALRALLRPRPTGHQG
ncbi:MAG: hypothetical protein H0S85_11975 [Desulfovibrionaceae bacterium]|jgi:hypothetical protein|nr:hypothetical protein [Desulfovibrionaceae bacterium]